MMNKRSIVLFVMLMTFLAVTGPAFAETVTYDQANGTKGYLARPAGSGPFPGIILIHEWWGLNDNIRKNADAFAQQGYVALAVDLYNGEVAATSQQARRLAGSVSGDIEGAFSNLRAAVSYLQGLKEVNDDRLASIGWCFGGGWSYQMAKNNLGLRASVVYYGRFNPADDLSIMRARILGNFGAEDRSISVDSVKEFQVTLKTLSGDHEIYIYPNAGHAFANAGSRSYNQEAAELAWKRTIAFLEKHVN
jgi:carboxymethylenebutenolidase